MTLKNSVHSLVLQVLADGLVRCWGTNRYGQLGHEDSSQKLLADSRLPVTALGDGMFVIQLAAGDEHTCAILQDSSLKCWGRGFTGQRGPQHAIVNDVGCAHHPVGQYLQD